MIEAIRREPPEDEERPRPNIKKLRDLLQGPFAVRSLALSGLLILATFYTLYLTQAFLLPIVLSLLFSFLLSPVVRFLRKLHIPNALGAGLVVFGLIGSVVWG